MRNLIFTFIALLLSFSIVNVIAQDLPYDQGNDNEEKMLKLDKKSQQHFPVEKAKVEELTQNGYTVKRGERPPIDLQALPDDAYEKGILKIKLHESFTDQLDNNPVFLDKNGAVNFNIASIDQLNQQFNANDFDELFRTRSHPSKFTERHRAWGFHLWYTLHFDETADIKELVMAYKQLEEVSIAEPQYRTELHNAPVPLQSETDKNSGPSPMDWTPNDPSLGLQWHYNNTGQESGTPGLDIDLLKAWNIETGNSYVIVSIHDGGVQYNHPDLNGNMWVNSGEIPGNGIDDDSNGYIDDIYGWDFYNSNASIEASSHGSHVGGTVAAESDNGTGVAGVAGGTGSNDGVRLMTCMVYLPAGGSGNGHHLAPVYAADNGACIEQNSWGYTYANSYDQAVLDAIDYFNANGGGSALTGGITIYAAGNHNAEGLFYPGCYSGTFSVAATNNQDIRSYYSTYGTWVDVSAPGGETNTVTARGVYSTVNGSSYGYKQGTSMACPHVSGTAALIVSLAYGQLTSTDVADIIASTTEDIDGLNPIYAGKLGSGRINTFNALEETLLNYLYTPGILMPIPEQTITNTGNVRGYWFTAPTDFTVKGLRVPFDIEGNQTIEIIRFNSGPPPTWTGTTNDFVSLGRWVNYSGTGVISCNIPVSNGDIIGILGCRGTTTSYGPYGPYSTNIGGNAVTLTRMGMQYPLTTTPAQDIWQEPANQIGRVEMYYEITPGIWTGAVDYWWNHAGNWSDGVVPDAYTNVTIPAGTPNDCWVAINDGFCNNITVESGALLRIYDEVLTVSGNMYIHGLLKLEEGTSSGVPGELHVGNDIVWESGSTAQILSNSLNMFITGDWNFQAGANVQLTQGYVTFEGSANSWIRNYDPDCYFSHIRNEKTGTYGLAVSELSMEDLYINGNIYNYSGNLFRFRSNHTVFLNGFLNNMGGHLEGQFGTLVFDGWPGTTTLKPNTGDYFNNLTISTNAVLPLDNVYSDTLRINGNLAINAGGINAQNFVIKVGGNWTNTVGTGGFVEGTSRVIFNGPGPDMQYVYGDETFNIIENNTVQAIRINNYVVTCASYDWTSGSISVSLGTFIANDLIDSGLYGSWYALTGSEIYLYQDAGQYVDVFSDNILIYGGGLIKVTGGADESYWCGGATPLDLEINTGGILDFDGFGITLWDNAVFTETITDGTIRTSGWFTNFRTDFNPSAGTFEFYGGDNADISMAAGSSFYNLLMNKSGGDKSSFTITDRDGKSSNSSKSNTANFTSDIVVSTNFDITDGTSNTLNANLYVGGNWSNTVGPAAFVENTNTVFMDGPNDGDILSEETFYNLTVNKSNANFTSLEVNQNVIVSNQLYIFDGVYEMNAGDLILGNDIIIGAGAGLNANDGPFNIYVGGNWTNYNATYDVYHGFWHGYISTVIFNNAGNNILTTSAPQEDFWNLTVYKAADQFRSNDNIQVFGKLLLFDGEWNDNVSGLTHTFHGDFEVTNNAAWFTHVSPNTVVFTGTGDQDFTYNHIGVGYFKHVIVDKVPADNAISSDLDPSGNQVAVKDDGSKAQMLTMLTDMDIQLSGTLTIDEGTVNVNGHTLRGDGNITINGGTLSLNSNSTLWLDDGAELSVNGGLLETIGTPGNLAHITHRNTGYYAFEVENGGTISAEYTLFEYTNANGVWIKGAGFADPVHTFHYCTFQNGTPGFVPLLVINNDQVLTLNGVNFPQTGVSDYNAAKAYDGGEMNMIGATGAFAGEAYEYDTYDRVHWTYPNRSIDITMFIEGPFESSTNKMSVGLNSVLPLDQPFDTPPLSNPSPDWYYTGLESVAAIPNPFIVDWVLVQLRDAPTAASAGPSTTIFTQAAFITNTGQIVDLDGLNPLNFSGSVTNNLYAVVWTRNHLGIISANALVDVGGTFAYDFSTAAGQALGGVNSQNLLSNSPIIWGTIPGDANATGLVAIGDKTNVWSLQAGESGYLESDYNFDGEADNVDKNDYWFPNMGDSSFIPE